MASKVRDNEITGKACQNPRFVTKVAVQRGCTIRAGKGSHSVATAQDGRGMTIPDGHGQISFGVACKIAKWLIALGIMAFIMSKVVFLIS